MQQNASVNWAHQDPLVKSKRVTNSAGTVISSVELDPWGGEVNHVSNQNQAFQPKKFTSYTRDAIGSDDAMHRRYNPWSIRFEQPDPYDGSYDLTNPQSFNRYAYVQNDPVNFVDPLGLDDDPLGPPPPVPTLIPYGGTIVTDTLAPYYSGGINWGTGIFDGDLHQSLTLINFPGGGLATDNPATIDNKDQGQDCNISVAFNGASVNGMTNGANYYHGDPGLGFTVSITGLSTGGVASIGPNTVDPKGKWVLQQLMNLTYWTVRKGDTAPQTGYVETFSDSIHPNSIIRYDNKSGGWIDHPGPNLKNGAGQILVAHHSKWNFLIKAYNGNKECSVAFHAEMTFSNGVFHANWGPGLY